MKSLSVLIGGLLVSVAAQAEAGSIVVGPGTAIDTLDADMVKRIFLGREATLGGKPLVVVFQKSGATREAFDGGFLGKPGAQLTSYWSKLVFTGKAKAPEEVADDAAVKAKVAATPGAIGYIEDAAVDGSVKKVFGY